MERTQACWNLLRDRVGLGAARWAGVSARAHTDTDRVYRTTVYIATWQGCITYSLTYSRMRFNTYDRTYAMQKPDRIKIEWRAA